MRQNYIGFDEVRETLYEWRISDSSSESSKAI